MEGEKEDDMNTRWVGSMRTNNYGAMLLQTGANLLPATVGKLWSTEDLVMGSITKRSHHPTSDLKFVEPRE